mmetsp:Transcript_6293/g.28420  ORF Transcript_6293/g.28420 Transcript_6293/m.28420 type:complete len:317 (+) Transcript_6293:3480-4430(+)
MVIPLHINAPRDWPALPSSLMSIVPSGRPSALYFLVTSCESMQPTVRFTLVMAPTYSTFSPLSMAGLANSMSVLSSANSRPWSWPVTLRVAAPGRMDADGVRILERSMPWSLSRPPRTSSSGVRRSLRPMSSSTEVYPMAAMCPRRSSARRKKKLTTSSSCPVNFARSSSSCVAIPTGQVFLWHLRIMMHPMVISGAVERPHSSAPRRVATRRSRPVLSCPSVWRTVRPRRSLATKVCCVSASPSSHGRPALLIPVQREAPVPPSWPEIKTWSALPLTTPAAMVPTPFSDTSLTLTRADGLLFLQSWMSCARSSME